MKDDLREQIAALTRRVEVAERERDGNADTLRDVLGWNVDRRCVQCGNTVEVERRVYAIPTCHACLPPPPPPPATHRATGRTGSSAACSWTWKRGPRGTSLRMKRKEDQ